MCSMALSTLAYLMEASFLEIPSLKVGMKGPLSRAICLAGVPLGQGQ
jgi:hypothetical protein